MKSLKSDSTPSQQWIREFQTALEAWYHSSSRDLPWRRTRDPYAIWISEIMLQQTQVDTVIPYYLRFLAALPTVTDLAQADDEGLMKLWEGLGYYSRARNLKKAAQVVMDQHHGTIPQDAAALQKLPGIGLYTAGAIGSIAFGLPLPAVDGNVIRVYSRLLAISENADTTNGKKYFHNLGTRLVVPSDPSSFNQAVMELGALICSPAAPQCHRCPVSGLCEANRQGNPLDFPVRSPKTPGRILHWTVIVYHRPGQIFMIPRSEETLLKGLWGFPMGPEPFPEPDVFTENPVIGTVKHVFTHQTWIMGVRALPAASDDALSDQYPEGIWVDRSAMGKLPLPKAFQKILPLIDQLLDS